MKYLVLLIMMIAFPALGKDKVKTKTKKRTPASVEWKNGHVNLYLGGGVITGDNKNKELQKIKGGMVGAKLSVLEIKLVDGNSVSLFAPGIGLQTNGEINLSVSPIMFSLENKYIMGIDIYPVNNSDNDMGHLGLFFGVRFGADGFFPE